MPDYDQPPYVTKRLRYYDNQFLLEQDFIDEQKHHIDRQRRHERLLHTPGIAEGLEVTKVGRMELSVAPGTAVDSLGRHILLATPRVVGVTGSGTQRLYLRFREVASDEAQGKGVTGATRFTQDPEFFLPAPDVVVGPEAVLVAEVTVTSGGIQTVGMGSRLYAGVRLPGLDGGQTLRSSTDGKKAELVGGLSVSQGLQVLGGAIVPKVGTTANDGIMFPTDPGGGSGDAAFIRYFATEGETAALRIGIDNDYEDALCLYQQGEDRLVIQRGAVSVRSKLEVREAITAPSLTVNNVDVGARLNSLGSEKLDKTGGTLTGGLTVSGVLKVGTVDVGARLTGLGSDKLDKIGGTVTGGLTVSGVLKVGTVDVGARLTGLGNDKLDKTGGTLTGALSVQGPLTVGTVDVGARLTGLGNEKLDKTGGTLTGALSVQGLLRMQGGAIVPTVGTSSSDGIYFPVDPGNGSGDAAFIQYSVLPETETTTLRIGINNDAEDVLCLQQMGQDRLVIRGGNVFVQSRLDVRDGITTASLTVSNVDVGARLTGLANDKLDKIGGAVTGALSVQGQLNVTNGNLIVDGYSVVRATNQERVRIVRGSVTMGGNISHGTGFTVHRVPGANSINKPGVLEIVFNPEFTDTPTVVASASWSSLVLKDSEVAGAIAEFDLIKSTDNVVLLGAQKHRVFLKTGDSYGNGAERHFHFIAIGPVRIPT
ncbi:hypothetical protein ACLESD_09090 [Pyxidicoccus sp. 3LFB2]